MLRLIVLLVALTPWIAGSQVNQAASPIPGNLPSPERNWGMPTNGICCEVNLIWNKEEERRNLPTVVCAIVNTNANDDGVIDKMNRDESNSNRAAGSLAVLRAIWDGEAVYYQPTNSFGGVFELTNSKGEKMQKLEPDVLSLPAYPLSFSLRALRDNGQPAKSFLHPLTGWYSPFAPIKLVDHFKAESPDLYTLTFSGKIYKRSATNSDLCERLDIPPVSVSFELQGGQAAHQ